MVVKRRNNHASRKAKRSFSIQRLILSLLVLAMLSRHQDYSSFFETSEHSTNSTGVSKSLVVLQREAANLLLEEISNKTVRSWGCKLTESPLIFVHIGKSGGGTTRARFAAAALNFTRLKWWNYNGDNHYYAMPTRKRLIQKDSNQQEQYSRGTFCSSANNNRRRWDMKKFAQMGFEQTFECNALTPLGRFVGCPAVFKGDQACKGCSDLSDSGCYTVYAGHNPMGNELHWLSAPMLQDWWQEKWETLFPPTTASFVQSITPGTSSPYWCPWQNKSRSATIRVPMRRRAAHKDYFDCSAKVSQEMDKAFSPAWQSLTDPFDGMEKNYAPFYASMPMHRTVVLREPFYWLMSRFFWAPEYRKNFACDDIPTATKHKNLTYNESGWAYKVVLDNLFMLCGEDCINRFEMDEIGLEEIEQQAEANLRHSFSVVGLLNETNSFYDMVSARIQYSNMSNNPHVVGPGHVSIKNTESRRCTREYKSNESLRAALREALPHFEVLERLYQVGIEVNRFQRQELSQCMNTTI